MKVLSTGPSGQRKDLCRVKGPGKLDYIVSQAAACDGTTITTTAEGQEITPGTLPTF